MKSNEAPVPQYLLDEAGLLRARTDDEVAAMVSRMPDHIAYPMEMQRRLVVALKDSKNAADRAARQLLRATWVLVVLTFVIAALTAVLLADAI